MLRVRKEPPVDYSLCDQTVTLYHAELGEQFSCTRTVFRGAHFDAKKVQTVDKTGSREVNSFLLVLPSGWHGRPVWAALRLLYSVSESFCFSGSESQRCCPGRSHYRRRS